MTPLDMAARWRCTWAGTFRASGAKSWASGAAHQPSASGFAAWRRMLDLPAGGPAMVIVTGSGSLDVRNGTLFLTGTNTSTWAWPASKTATA